jgi:hypothetical protein
VPDPENPNSEIEVNMDVQIDPSLRLQIREMEILLAKMDKDYESRKRDDASDESDEESYLKPTLSIHSNAQARYLVQDWEGGTICDMTGKARKIEVEFHCSSDGVDGIVGVKEIST